MAHFEEVTNKLAPEKLHQISMDGPKVNLKFYKEVEAKYTESFYHSLSVHSVHGAVKSGVESTSWGIKGILKGGFNLLHDLPAHSEDFQVVTKSNLYPLYFCATRWVENKCVADRMVEVWPNIKKVMKFWKSLPKYKQPTCKSYSKNSDAVIDLFTEAKIIFFSFICSIVEPYLKKYQCEKPIVPFMYVDLRSIATNLLQLIAKPEVLEKCKTVGHLAEINLDGKGNLLPINKAEQGFGVHGLLNNLSKQDIITIDETKKLGKEVQCFVVSTLKKTFDRNPFTCEFFRYCAVLNPVVLDSREQKSCHKYFKLLLNEHIKQNILSPSKCDAAVIDFTNFCSSNIKSSE